MIKKKWNIIFAIIVSFSFFCSSQNLENLRKPKPIGFHSGVTLQSDFYHVNGIDPRREALTWTIAGSPSLDFYGVSVPLNFVLSNHHSRFQQPFNQFGINPYYKWARLHLGYSNVKFSPFTLSGHRFLGIGAEINPGKFRFGAIYGRFKKAVEEDTAYVNDKDDFLLSRPIPAYSRKGYAVKVGVGSKKNYFDLIFLKAKDKINSIPTPVAYMLFPEENAVLGASSGIQLHEKLSWHLDLGVSANTRDQLADSLDLDDWDFPLKNAVNKILLPRSTTQLTTAGETSLSYKDKNFSLKATYRRVDPEYTSMGVYYMQKDMVQYSVAPAFALLERKLHINGTFGIQKNNLYESKSATTKRIIGSANVLYNPGKIFGLNINYSNYGITQSPQVASLSDTTLLEQISQNLSISPRLTFAGNHYVHSVFLSGNYNELSDKSESIIYKSEMQSRSAYLTYNLNLISKKMNINTSGIFRTVATIAGETNSIGFGAGMSKRFVDNKMAFQVNYTFFANTFEGISNGSTHQIRGRASVVVLKKHQFFINSYYLKNTSPNEATSISFNEFTGSIGCNLIFSNR
jgi:hypothetical protein